MHTLLQMHLEYITSVVGLTEMYSGGIYNLGRGVNEDNYLLYMKTHFS